MIKLLILLYYFLPIFVKNQILFSKRVIRNIFKMKNLPEITYIHQYSYKKLNFHKKVDNNKLYVQNGYKTKQFIQD